MAKLLYDNNWTPGEFAYQLLKQGKKYIPDFYRSDLQNEFDRIWNFQKQFYSDILTDELKEKLVDAKIHTQVMGSDHCPVELEIKEN